MLTRGGWAPCAWQGQEVTRKTTRTSKEKTGKAGKRRERGRVRKGMEKTWKKWQRTLNRKGEGAQKRKGKDKVKDTGIEVATLGWFWKTRAHPRQHLPKETTMEVEL